MKERMSKVKDLERQIKGLSADELATFRQWFAAFDAEAWDRNFEADVTTGKRGGWPRRRSGITQRDALRPRDAPRHAPLLGLLPDPPALRSRLSDGFPEHAERVLAQDLSDVGFAVSAPDQPLDDSRNLGRILE